MSHSRSTETRAPAGAATSSGTDIAVKLLRERERLLREAGLETEERSHFRRPAERKFVREERDRVTLLFGGITLRHEQLIQAGLEGLGYRCAQLPTPTKADFQAGREYGNNGQCNPTYFTVGALVNHLKRLRDEDGVPVERILDDYVFITAGSCGPCRFGMYEAEYRLALRNSGFDGFRVLLFQQEGSLDQTGGEDEEPGFAVNTDFVLTFLNAVFIGDLLNEVAYGIRPYETEPGATERVFARCVALVERQFREKDHGAIRGGMLARLLSRVAPVGSADDTAKYLDQLRGEHYVEALRECASAIDEEIEVDYTRPKPVVKVTGEFWAQTTEGDGNFRMFPFLESQGAEVIVEPITTWLNYLIHQAGSRARDDRGLDAVGAKGLARLSRKVRSGIGHAKQAWTFRLAERLLNREYDRLRMALGGTAHAQANQLELQRMGHPYYHSRAEGGEGHLEVAKNIYYASKGIAHMVLSLKPFGCMPSTQSDGAQAAVVSHFPEMIFLPIETSGEGDVNAHSRVQMALGEAKVKTREEFRACVERTGRSLEEIRAYVANHRELRRPFQEIPHEDGVVGKAARFVLHVGRLMDRDRRSA